MYIYSLIWSPWNLLFVINWTICLHLLLHEFSSPSHDQALTFDVSSVTAVGWHLQCREESRTPVAKVRLVCECACVRV